MTPDDACRSVYQGDAVLDRMLAKAGARKILRPIFTPRTSVSCTNA